MDIEIRKLIPTHGLWIIISREMSYLESPRIVVMTSKIHPNLYWGSSFIFNGNPRGNQLGWASNSNDKHFITVYFIEAVRANVVFISGTENNTYPPTAFEVWASNDSMNWELIKAFKEIKWEPNENKRFQFENTKEYNYYKIAFVESNSSVFAISQLNFGEMG